MSDTLKAEILEWILETAPRAGYCVDLNRFAKSAGYPRRRVQLVTGDLDDVLEWKLNPLYPKYVNEDKVRTQIEILRKLGDA